MTTATRMQRYRKGLWAEMLAEFFLRLKGYQILQRRYKTPVGEIDLLAVKNNTLIAVEVKARETFEKAITAVNVKTQNRIQRAVEFFLSHHPGYADQDIRFDVITIRPPFFIRHMDNAWRPRS